MLQAGEQQAGQPVAVLQAMERQVLQAGEEQEGRMVAELQEPLAQAL